MSSDSEEEYTNKYFMKYVNEKKKRETAEFKLQFYKSLMNNLYLSDKLPQFTGVRSLNKTLFTPFHELTTGEFELPKNLYFLTITFDPSRFTDLESVTETSKKEYVLRHLQDKFNRQFITRIYGCFEYTKKMEIHVHCILLTGRPSDLKYLLKCAFAESTENAHCIDLQPVESPKNVIRYIEKESFDYFFIGPETALKAVPLKNPLDDGLPENEWKEVEPDIDPIELLKKYDESAELKRKRFIQKLVSRYKDKGMTANI